MPHDDHVHVVGHHLYGVFESLSFADTCVCRVGEAYYFGPKPVDGCLETEPRPCGGLEEDAGYHLALKYFLHPVFFEFPGYFQHMQDLVLGEILD